MVIKNRVDINFSKAIKSYDEFAHIQKKMASNLILQVPTLESNSKILEVGCGTGILTEKILELNSNFILTVNDISKNMLLKFSEKIKNENISQIHGDVESIDFYENYDLIISNAVFQWFTDYYNTLGKLINILKKDGVFLFSQFVSGTYKELEEAISNICPNKRYIQNFLNISELKDFLESKNCIFDLIEDEYIEEFSTLLDFFRKIKMLGTNSAFRNKSNLTPGDIRKSKNIIWRIIQIMVK